MSVTGTTTRLHNWPRESQGYLGDHTIAAHEGRGIRLLGVFAHPDDETFCAAGTIARHAKAGAEVMVVSATRGEAGQIRDARVADRHTIGAVREAELRLACRRLGVAHVQCWGHVDGTLADVDFDELVDQVSRVIRQFRPDVVITFGSDGGYGHPDHVTISTAVTAACERLSDFDSDRDEFTHELAPGQPCTLYQSYFPARDMLLMDRLAVWLTSRPDRFAGTTDFVHALMLMVKEAGTMRYLNDHAQVQWYPAGAYVVEQGEASNELFVILSGNADVWQEDEHGSRHRLRVLGPGEFFGELGVADNRPRSAAVVAVDGLTCLALSRAAPTKFAGRGAGARLTGPAPGAVTRRPAADAHSNGPDVEAAAVVDEQAFGPSITAIDLDVADEIAAKIAALCAYRSQFPFEPGMFPDSVMTEIFGRECFVEVRQRRHGRDQARVGAESALG